MNLLGVLGEANRQLGDLQREIEQGYIALVTPHRERYAKLQATVSETEAALEVIARRNASWFADEKTVKTPFGGVKFRSSTELVVTDESISVQLILALAGKEGASRFLRTVQVLNKEELEKLSDAELAKFGIVRKTKENFSASTDVVDLGKAVKAADKSERAAAKVAKKAASVAAALCVALVFFFAPPAAIAATFCARAPVVAPLLVKTPAKPVPVVVTAPTAPVQAPATTAPAFVPLTKAELVRALQNLILGQSITRLGLQISGAPADSAAVREVNARIEAYTRALELADLLP